MTDLLNAFSDPGQLVIECGIDEAGAGALCGPLYVAAVILPPECPQQETDEDTEICKYHWDRIRDSKKISPRQREILADFIKEIALDYSIIAVGNKEIDTINIRNARLKGFHRAIDGLNIIPELILVDGDIFNSYKTSSGTSSVVVPHQCIIDGDSKYKSIAAASILAKTSRDAVMIELSKEFPEYHWENNKGYGTAGHYAALHQYGITGHHRMSYNLHTSKFI